MGRVFVWIGGIFGGFGLLFVAIAGWLYLRDRNFADGAAHARGTVVEMAGSGGSNGYSYTPVVEFRDADGRPHRFASGVSSSPPRYSTGDSVEVIYRPEAPDHAKIDEFLDRFFLLAVFGGLGTLFTAIGGGMLFHVTRRTMIDRQLRTNGVPIQAKVTDFYLDTSLTVNGRNPWRVVCEAVHPGTGQMQSFTSEALWAYPNTEMAGRQVRVFVDPAHPSHHLVDMTPYVDESAIG